MNDKNIVKAALARTGTSQAELSNRIGYSNKTSLATMLCRQSTLRTDVLFKILDALGFEIVVRPKNKADNTEWVLADNDEKIKAERFVNPSEIAAIRSEMKPPAKGDLNAETKETGR